MKILCHAAQTVVMIDFFAQLMDVLHVSRQSIILIQYLASKRVQDMTALLLFNKSHVPSCCRKKMTHYFKVALYTRFSAFIQNF